MMNDAYGLTRNATGVGPNSRARERVSPDLGQRTADTFGDQSHRPHRYSRGKEDRGFATPGTGAHRPRCARPDDGPYGDCHAGRSLRPGTLRSRNLRCAWTRNAPCARKCPEGHPRQRRRTIGRQVGTTTQVLDMEIHRFQ
ncbi:hypothetical protein Slala05_67390 [Streptomyces lavendulae subsp. lavendulae]|nr:hypothetical protein Slala05_67390 [Streptomyces lavendulae subsp. lavendulae]